MSRFQREWEMTRVGSLGSIYGGLSGKSKSDFDSGEAAYISFLDVVSNVEAGQGELPTVRVEPNESQNRVASGDLLFNGSSETPDELALCAAVPVVENPTYLNSFCFGLRLDAERHDDPLFLAYLFRSSVGRRQLRSLAQGSTRYNISKSRFRRIELPLPSPTEQCAIAAALSDTDALIEALESLLVKKRDIKQAVMQQLLTGRARLPGFEGEWETRTIRDAFSIRKGQQRGRRELTESGRFPVWNGGTEPSGFTHESNSPQDSITVSEGGNSCGYVGLVREPFWLGGHCYVLDPTRLTDDKKYLFQTLKLLQSQIMGLRVGSGLPNIQKKQLGEFPITTSQDPAEQRAIATVLSDMDAEIEALEARLAKTRDIKVGMMQELLTGRTRLPIPEGSDEASDVQGQGLSEPTRGEAEPGDSDADSPEVEGALA